jgi:dymeclin
MQARTDIDVVVLPILELLMDIKKKKVNQVYILLIILLMLSQESAFGYNANGLILKDVGFYKARPLHTIRLDSLMVLVLLHVALYNIHLEQDMYLHTNTLAILANIAPTLSDIFPAACQRILNILEKLYERFQSPTDEDKGNDDSSPQLEMQLVSDFFSIILELLNSVVVNNLTNNPTLVYCMLHKKECLERIWSNPQYSDMAYNISIVTKFFGDRIEKEISANRHGLTAERIQDRIVFAMRQWNTDTLQISTDLKFSYEEGTFYQFMMLLRNVVPCNSINIHCIVARINQIPMFICRSIQC